MADEEPDIGASKRELFKIENYVELEYFDIEILTDEKWFSFALEQILSNALKYTKEGGITIFTREI